MSEGKTTDVSNFVTTHSQTANLLTPPSDQSSKIELLTASLNKPVARAYGRHIVGGNVIYQSKSAVDGLITAFVALGQGEWNAIEKLWISGAEQTLPDTSRIHFHPGIAGQIGIESDPETPNQQCCSFWPSGFAPQLAFSRLAYLGIKLPNDPIMPDVALSVVGIYQTQKITTFDQNGTFVSYAYNVNPAWVALDLIMFRWLYPNATSQSAYLNPVTACDMASFVDAAAYCDELIDGVPRFECHLAFVEDTDLMRALNQVMLTCNGYMVERNGKLAFYIDKPRASSGVAARANILAGSLQLNKKDTSALANKYVIKYRSLDSGGEDHSKDFQDRSPEFDDLALQDKLERVTNAEMDIGNSTDARSRMIGEYVRDRSVRLLDQARFVLLPGDSIDLLPGDVIDVPNDIDGWTSADHEILEISDEPDGSRQAFTQEVISVGEPQASPPPIPWGVQTAPPVHQIPSAVRNLSVVIEGAVFVLSWRSPASGASNLDNYIIQYSPDEDFEDNVNTLFDVGKVNCKVFTFPNKSLYFRVAAHNQTFLASDETTAEIVTDCGEDGTYGWGPFAETGPHQSEPISAPEIAEGVFGTATFASGIAPVELVSSMPAPGIPGRIVFLTQADGEYTANTLYRDTGTEWTTDILGTGLVGGVTGSQLAEIATSTAKFASTIKPIGLVAALPAPGIPGRIVFLTAQDGDNDPNKMYKDTGTGWVTAIDTGDLTGRIGTSQLTDGALTVAKFASTIKPVELVSTLGAPGTQGRVVFLTAQDGSYAPNKLYRDTGTAWTVDVPAADLSGQLSTGQLQDGAVTIPKLLVVPPGAALNVDPGPSDASAWSFSNAAIVTVTDGKVGNKAVRSTAAAYSTAQEIKQIPVDPLKIYRVRAWVRRVNADQPIYLTLNLLDAAGDIIAGEGTYWYYWASAVTPTNNVWTEYIGYFGPGTTKGSVPSNARTMSMGPHLLNYFSPTVGYYELQDMRIEEVIPPTLIADGAITTDKVAANAITAGKIYSHTITAGEIAAGAIGATEIAAGAITTAKLAVATLGAALNPDPNISDPSAWGLTNAAIAVVTTGKVGNSVLRSTSALAGLAVGTTLIPVDPSKVYRLRLWARGISSPNQPFYAYLSLQDSAGANITGSGGYWHVWAAGSPGATWTEYVGYFGPNTVKGAIPAEARTMIVGPIRMNYPTPSQGYYEIQDVRLEEVLPNTLIADGAIDSNKIYTYAVTTDKIAANAIGADQIAANCITAGQIAAGAISATELSVGAAIGNIADGAIAGTKIADGAIVTDKLYANAVTAAKIAANTITASQIAANTITAGQIAAGAISATELSATAIDGKTITGSVVQTSATGKRAVFNGTDGLILYGSGVTNRMWQFDMDGDIIAKTIYSNYTGKGSGAAVIQFMEALGVHSIHLSTPDMWVGITALGVNIEGTNAKLKINGVQVVGPQLPYFAECAYGADDETMRQWINTLRTAMLSHGLVSSTPP